MIGMKQICAAVALASAMSFAPAAFSGETAHQHDMAAGKATVGALALDGAWTRQPPPGARVAGGYVLITNNGDDDDVLLGGSAPFADHFEVHEMVMDGGMMRMSPLNEGLPIPAGETVTLEPGGFHLMFMQLNTLPQKGETVPVTLQFKEAGAVTLMFPVAAMGAMTQGGHHGHSHSN